MQRRDDVAMRASHKEDVCVFNVDLHFRPNWRKQSAIRGVPATLGMEPVQRIHVGLQGPRPDSSVSRHGQARRLSRRSIQPELLTRLAWYDILAGRGRPGEVCAEATD